MTAVVYPNELGRRRKRVRGTLRFWRTKPPPKAMQSAADGPAGARGSPSARRICPMSLPGCGSTLPYNLAPRSFGLKVRVVGRGVEKYVLYSHHS